jgi:hypothetical protein
MKHHSGARRLDILGCDGGCQPMVHRSGALPVEHLEQRQRFATEVASFRCETFRHFGM